MSRTDTERVYAGSTHAAIDASNDAQSSKAESKVVLFIVGCMVILFIMCYIVARKCQDLQSMSKATDIETTQSE